ncbi:hypothetical protein OSTOST_04923, partial [Ostertagia ostertagi]
MAESVLNRLFVVTQRRTIALSHTVVWHCSGTHVPSLAKRLQDAGIPSYFYEDRSKFLRPFTIIRALHSFEVTHDFDAGTANLHKACEAFEHGYAATPYDFADPENFKNVLKEGGVNIVAVPGRRSSSSKLPNLQDCSRDPNYMDRRNQFVFDLKDKYGKTIEKKRVTSKMAKRLCGMVPTVPTLYTFGEDAQNPINGGHSVTSTHRLMSLCQVFKIAFPTLSKLAAGIKTAKNASFWAMGFPDRTCADMPRVALAYTQNGLVDVPNNARLFTVCTFGTPPDVSPDDGSEKCHADAKFVNGKCRCLDEKKDIRNTKAFVRRSEDKLHAE